jgi:1,4-dihydroxy-2-naphthoate octaprenyltransferase
MTESYAERRNREYKEQIAARKKERRKAVATKVVCWTIGVVLALVLATVAFQLLVWNLGIVGLATALGASVSKISFWTALGGLFAWSAVGGLLHGSPVAVNKS